MHLDETPLMFDEQEMRKGFEKKTTFIRWLRENNALQLKKAHANRLNSRKQNKKKTFITQSCMSTTSLPKVFLFTRVVFSRPVTVFFS